MAGAAEHNKNMKDFVRSEILVSGIKDRQLQCVDHTADGVDDPTSQQPAKSGFGQCVDDREKGQDTQPAHSNVQYRGNPFGAGYPEGFKKDSKDCCGPYQGAKGVSYRIVKDDQADGGVASCYHNKDHHMIQLLQSAVHLRRRINGMMKSTCRIKQHHRKNKHSQCHDMNMIAPL